MMGAAYWESVFILKLMGHQSLADFSLLLLFGFPLKKICQRVPGATISLRAAPLHTLLHY